MSSRSHALVEGIGEYVRELGRRSEDEVLRRLRERTLEMPHGGMQISPEQGAFMQLLVAARPESCQHSIGYSNPASRR